MHRLLLLLSPLLLLTGCRRHGFPEYPENYREFAYISDGAANAVTILDLVYLRQDRVLQVGSNPTGLAVNPRRDEVYVVNTGSNSVSVIDAATNRVVSTIGVHRRPYFIAVSPDGRRAYVPNSLSNTVSVLDLDSRREIATAATGEGPGVARVSPDNRTLVVTNQKAGSISLYTIAGPGANSDTQPPLTFRRSFSGCAGATDAAILPDSSKVFVACSGSHQVMAVWLAAAPGSWYSRRDPALEHDQLLTFLDVGNTPTHLALERDGDEHLFSTNFGSDSISEISTWTNEVLSTYVIGAKPSRAIISRDNSTLWVTNFGADSASLYSIDDGRMEAGIRIGSRPDALAFSADEHLLLVADTGSADVAVIRTQSRNGPALVTLLPAGNQPNDLVTLAFRAK